MPFTFPYDSSPPATPGKSRNSNSNSLASNPSTTPAGPPPPSSAASFTPQGPPPSTTYGSSRIGTKLDFTQSNNSTFSQSGVLDGSGSLFSSFGASKFPPTTFQSNTAANGTKKSGAFTGSFGSQSMFGSTNGSQPMGAFGTNNGKKSQLSQQIEDDDGEDEEEEEEEEEDEEDGDYEDEEDGDYEDEEGDSYNEEEEEDDEENSADENEDTMDFENTKTDAVPQFGFYDSKFGNSSSTHPSAAGAQRKSIYTNPGSAKRAKLDEQWINSPPATRPQIGPRKKPSNIPSIIRDMAGRSKPAPVTEPSDMIIATEDYIGALLDKAKEAEYGEVDFVEALSRSSTELWDTWEACATRETRRQRKNPDSIGPDEHAEPFAKAAFVASLLLSLHHPPPFGDSEGNVKSLVSLESTGKLYKPIPQVLIEWLNRHHTNHLDNLKSLQAVTPNPTASPVFWDAILINVLRGNFAAAVQVLRSADFNYARSALEDGMSQPGYRGAQLQNIQRSVNKAVQILESSPAVQHGDWNINGVEWSIYRKRVTAALRDLEDFAEGEAQPPLPAPSSNRGGGFQAVNFGMSASATAPQNGFSFTQSSRMAESRIPWSIYQNLKSLYTIILGDPTAILARATNWVEATVGLTVWWDGEDDTPGIGLGANGFNASTASQKSSRARTQVPRSVDANPHDAYLRRLDNSFAAVTEGSLGETGFQPNTLNSIEVALASVLEGDVDGVLELLQTWSQCIASATAEAASAGGWLNASAKRPLIGGLDDNALNVLSYPAGGNPALRPTRKDDLLVSYADGLSERPVLEDSSGVREGWEVALEVISRVEDKEARQKKVGDILAKLPLDTEPQVDKVVLLCTDLGLESEGRKISERFSDQVATNSENYGVTLIYYARAHSIRKVKSVLDLLISYSLVQSRAFPPADALDAQLRSLLKDPKKCLSILASIDTEAARILQFYFSGYATLRRFYDIRDESLAAKEGQAPKLRPLARRRAAADALVAVIGSASDSIYGGLYDPDRDSAVQVDGLLTLLGEALVFVAGPSNILNIHQQSTILSAIEDLETVTPRVFAQCEECYRSTLLHYHSYERGAALPPSPHALLRKSVSSGLTASTFSLIGSEMLGSLGRSSTTGSGSGTSSGVLVSLPESTSASSALQKSKRGWDWRAGLPEDAKAQDILRILRLGLAKGLSFGAIGGGGLPGQARLGL